MNEENKIIEVSRVDDKDWFLQKLVNMVNYGKWSFGITLNVGGFLVSGNLIGGKEYFEGFSDEFAGALKGLDGADEVKNVLSKNGDIYTSGEDMSLPSYVHIKGARFFNTNGNPIPGNRGVWWRGRISEVDGFSLGSLSSDNT